jgi:hypothetical protein
LTFLAAAGVQFIVGVVLRTGACSQLRVAESSGSEHFWHKSGWGIAHMIMGGLTTLQLPCIVHTKCRVGARRPPLVPVAVVAVQQAMQQVSRGELPRVESIPLQEKRQPEATAEVASMMEKAGVELSPLTGERTLSARASSMRTLSGIITLIPTLSNPRMRDKAAAAAAAGAPPRQEAAATAGAATGQEHAGVEHIAPRRMDRVICRVCKGAGIVSQSITCVREECRPMESPAPSAVVGKYVLYEYDTALAWQQHATPPTLKSVGAALTLTGQLLPGDQVLRVAYMIAPKLSSSSSDGQVAATAADLFVGAKVVRNPTWDSQWGDLDIHPPRLWTGTVLGWTSADAAGAVAAHGEGMGESARQGWAGLAKVCWDDHESHGAPEYRIGFASEYWLAMAAGGGTAGSSSLQVRGKETVPNGMGRCRLTNIPALDCAKLSGAELECKLRAMQLQENVDPSLRRDEEVQLRMLTILRPHGQGRRAQDRMQAMDCFLCGGVGSFDESQSSFSAPSRRNTRTHHTSTKQTSDVVPTDTMPTPVELSLCTGTVPPPPEVPRTVQPSLPEPEPEAPQACVARDAVEYDTAPDGGEHDTASDGGELFPCEICYDSSEFGMSTECLHFYCRDCIRGSLQGILDSGQFPAYCPACRVESQGSDEAEPSKGRVEGPALTFLQQKGVIDLDFQFRFMRQQDSSDEQYFKCPAAGCGRYLIDQDPQWKVVPRGKSEVEGFERQMRLGKCVCGARVCVRCHLEAKPGRVGLLTKLAEVTKEDLGELRRAGGLVGKMCSEVMNLLGVEHGASLLVRMPTDGDAPLEEAPEEQDDTQPDGGDEGQVLPAKFDRADDTHVEVSWGDAAAAQEEGRGNRVSVSRISLPTENYSHRCPPQLDRKLSTDAATRKLMSEIGKHCPNCGAFIQKNEGAQPTPVALCSHPAVPTSQRLLVCCRVQHHDVWDDRAREAGRRVGTRCADSVSRSTCSARCRCIDCFCGGGGGSSCDSLWVGGRR